eukprot:m51a1_g3103 hypothetical protein (363) ;mRNA; f:123151-125234
MEAPPAHDYATSMESARRRLSADDLARLDAETDAALAPLAALPPGDLARAACATLLGGEPNTELAAKVLRVLGRERFVGALRRADECVRRGGLATEAEGGRMRTPGGVFFFLARAEATKKEWREIAYIRRPQQRQQQQRQQGRQGQKWEVRRVAEGEDEAAARPGTRRAALELRRKRLPARALLALGLCAQQYILARLRALAPDTPRAARRVLVASLPQLRDRMAVAAPAKRAVELMVALRTRPANCDVCGERKARRACPQCIGAREAPGGCGRKFCSRECFLRDARHPRGHVSLPLPRFLPLKGSQAAADYAAALSQSELPSSASSPSESSAQGESESEPELSDEDEGDGGDGDGDESERS